MATPLRRLIETAFVTYLGEQSIGTTNIYPGMGTANKTAPCVICEATSAEEEPVDSGNFRAQVRLTVKGLAKDGVDAFDAICDAVRAAIYKPDLNTSLQSATTGLTVWGTASESRLQWAMDEDCWTESIEVELYCCARTFAA